MFRKIIKGGKSKQKKKKKKKLPKAPRFEWGSKCWSYHLCNFLLDQVHEVRIFCKFGLEPNPENMKTWNNITNSLNLYMQYLYINIRTYKCTDTHHISTYLVTDHENLICFSTVLGFATYILSTHAMTSWLHPMPRYDVCLPTVRPSVTNRESRHSEDRPFLDNKETTPPLKVLKLESS